jgi:hypothetical protein
MSFLPGGCISTGIGQSLILEAHKKSHEGTLPPEGLQAFMALDFFIG